MLGKWYLAHCPFYFAKLVLDGWMSFTVRRHEHARGCLFPEQNDENNILQIQQTLKHVSRIYSML